MRGEYGSKLPCTSSGADHWPSPPSRLTRKAVPLAVVWIQAIQAPADVPSLAPASMAATTGSPALP